MGGTTQNARSDQNQYTSPSREQKTQEPSTASSKTSFLEPDYPVEVQTNDREQEGIKGRRNRAAEYLQRSKRAVRRPKEWTKNIFKELTCKVIRSSPEPKESALLMKLEREHSQSLGTQENLAGESVTMEQATLDQSIMRSVLVEQPLIDGNTEAVTMDIEAVDGKESSRSDETAEGRREAIASGRKPKLETYFYIMFHKQPSGADQYVAKLDTASEVNVISEDVVDHLQVELKSYKGARICPLGEKSIQPKGEVTLRWHVKDKTKTYTDTFAVLDKSLSTEFDVLLCDKTIDDVGFFIKNHDVWFCKNAS
ncbi:MAG: hypothetical protein Q9191_002054 [Dirinaria sp. TL-2023a]